MEIWKVFTMLLHEQARNLREFRHIMGHNLYKTCKVTVIVFICKPADPNPIFSLLITLVFCAPWLASVAALLSIMTAGLHTASLSLHNGSEN